MPITNQKHHCQSHACVLTSFFSSIAMITTGGGLLAVCPPAGAALITGGVLTLGATAVLANTQQNQEPEDTNIILTGIRTIGETEPDHAAEEMMVCDSVIIERETVIDGDFSIVPIPCTVCIPEPDDAPPIAEDTASVTTCKSILKHSSVLAKTVMPPPDAIPLVVINDPNQTRHTSVEETPLSPEEEARCRDCAKVLIPLMQKLNDEWNGDDDDDEEEYVALSRKDYKKLTALLQNHNIDTKGMSLSTCVRYAAHCIPERIFMEEIDKMASDELHETQKSYAEKIARHKSKKVYGKYREDVRSRRHKPLSSAASPLFLLGTNPEILYERKMHNRSSLWKIIQCCLQGGEETNNEEDIPQTETDTKIQWSETNERFLYIPSNHNTSTYMGSISPHRGEEHTDQENPEKTQQTHLVERQSFCLLAHVKKITSSLQQLSIDYDPSDESKSRDHEVNLKQAITDLLQQIDRLNDMDTSGLTEEEQEIKSFVTKMSQERLTMILSQAEAILGHSLNISHPLIT